MHLFLFSDGSKHAPQLLQSLGASGRTGSSSLFWSRWLCQVLIFMHCAPRFPSGKFWNCSALFLPARVATKYGELAPSTDPVLQEVARSLSIWAKTPIVASAADQKETSWTCGPQQLIKASMTQPSTFAKNSTSQSPGSIGGEAITADVLIPENREEEPVLPYRCRSRELCGRTLSNVLQPPHLTQFHPRILPDILKNSGTPIHKSLSVSHCGVCRVPFS
jgi:hypothetical protein